MKNNMTTNVKFDLKSTTESSHLSTIQSIENKNEKQLLKGEKGISLYLFLHFHV